MINRQDARRRTGFTLVEVLIVIGLLAVIGTVAVVGYTRIQANATRKAARVMVDQTKSAVELYYTDMKTYPSAEEGLTMLVSAPEEEADAENWAGPYLKDGQVPNDPWGNPIQYELLDTGLGEDSSAPFRVWSYGPDEQDGTDDDISSVQDNEDAL